MNPYNLQGRWGLNVQHFSTTIVVSLYMFIYELILQALLSLRIFMQKMDKGCHGYV
jgi:hypothetical protein